MQQSVDNKFVYTYNREKNSAVFPTGSGTERPSLLYRGGLFL